MEHHIEIQTNDGKVIYGTLNRAHPVSKKLVVFVHGLTGDKDEQQYINAVPFFTSRGYDTFRFDLYSDEEHGRALVDCSISTHATDIDTVLAHFANKYDELYLIGHSLGAIAVLHTQSHIAKKIVLWDPSKGMSSLEQKDCTYSKPLDLYILNWRMSVLINQQMVDEYMKASDIQHSLSLVNKPCKFIFAENCDIYEGWKPYLHDLKFQSEVVVISGASHTFIEEGTLNRLYEETYKWITKSS